MGAAVGGGSQFFWFDSDGHPAGDPKGSFVCVGYCPNRLAVCHLGAEWSLRSIEPSIDLVWVTLVCHDLTGICRGVFSLEEAASSK